MSSWPLPICCLTLGTALLAWTHAGEAEPLPGVSVRWIAPSGCPTADELRARVRRLLPVDAAVSPAADRLVADGMVEVVYGHYRLRLSVRRNGEVTGVTRVFESDTCESLAGAAAVTLALLAGGGPRSDAAATPASTASPTPSQPAPPGATDTKSPAPGPAPAEALTSTPPAATTRSSESPTVPPARARLAPYLEVPLLAVDQGMLPSLGSGIGVGAGLRIRGVRLVLTGRLWLPQDNARSVYEATYERRSGAVSGCYGWTLGAFDLGPCFTWAIEDVTAQGAGPDVVGDSGHVTWLTVGLAVRAGWSLSRWAAVFLRPSLTFNTSRPTFAIDGVGPMYQVPLASVGVDLGCEWIL